MLRLFLALLFIPLTLEAANAPVKSRKAAPLVSWMPADEWYIQFQMDYEVGKYDDFLAAVDERYHAQLANEQATPPEPLSARKEKQTIEYYQQLEALKAERNRQLMEIAAEYPKSYVGKVIVDAFKPLEPFTVEQANQEYLNAKLPAWMRAQFGNGTDPYAKYNDLLQESEAKIDIVTEMLGENGEYPNREWLARNIENARTSLSLVKLNKIYHRCKELNDQNCKERFDILIENFDLISKQFHDKLFLNALGMGFILPSNEPESKVGDVMRNYIAQSKLLNMKLGFPVPSRAW